MYALDAGRVHRPAETLATLSGTMPMRTLSSAVTVEVVVKVARQYDFDGEFKVQLVLPPGSQGVYAAEVTIPAGKDEAKLVLMRCRRRGTRPAQ